jgi:hypothetical protein
MARDDAESDPPLLFTPNERAAASTSLVSDSANTGFVELRK